MHIQKNNGTQFDVVSVMLFAGDNGSYVDREASVLREFSFMGIHAEPFRHVMTAYDTVVERNIRHTRMCSGGYMNSTIGHLYMIKSAYNRGASTALFFEDDIRFLRDRHLARDVIGSVPHDFGIALFDWLFPLDFTNTAAIARDMANVENSHWMRFDRLNSAGAYAMSRDTMAATIDVLESAASNGELRLIDQLYRHIIRTYGIKGYAAIPNVCTQCATDSHMSYEDTWRRYGLAGLKREDYNNW